MHRGESAVSSTLTTSSAGIIDKRISGAFPTAKELPEGYFLITCPILSHAELPFYMAYNIGFAVSQAVITTRVLKDIGDGKYPLEERIF
jgi:hypothetical protein